MNFKLISIIVLIALVSLFIVQNIAIVEFKYLFWSVQMSRAIFMLILLMIGIVIGWILHAHFTNNNKIE